MNFYAFSALVALIFTTIIGFVVWNRADNRALGKYFGLISLCVCLWVLGCFGESFFSHKFSYIFDLILYTGATLSPSLFLHFLLTFTESVKKRMAILILCYTISLFYLFLNWIPSARHLFIKEVIRGYDYRSIAEPAMLWYVFIGLYTLTVSYCFYILWTYIKKSPPAKKNQGKYIMLAYFILVFAGTLYFGLVLNINSPPIDNFFTISYGLIMSYAILRFRLWDLRFLLREATKYLISAGLLGILFFGTILFLTGNLRISSAVFGICLIVPFFHKKTYAWITKLRIQSGLVDKRLSEKIHTLPDRIKEAGYKISDLAQTVSQICMDSFPIKCCSMLFLDFDKSVFCVEWQTGLTGKIDGDIPISDPLIQYLGINKQILVKSEAERFLNKDNFNSIAPSFLILEAEVVSPLIVLDRVVGILTLGPKRDGQPYFVNEINELDLICAESSTALRYVLAVSQAAAETKRWAHSLNQDLKPLSEAFDYLKDNDPLAGKDPDQTEVYNQIKKPLKRLANFLYYLTHQARITDESLRNKYEFIPINIKDILERTISRQKGVADRKETSILVDIIRPELNGHSRDLTIAFEAILSNALRYVPSKGHINISGKNIGQTYRVIFENDGLIIPKQHLEDIFTEGFQIKDGLEGMGGLGLANVKRIIDMHNGKIWAENTGETHGVRFIIDLPLDKSLSEGVQPVHAIQNTNS